MDNPNRRENDLKLNHNQKLTLLRRFLNGDAPGNFDPWANWEHAQGIIGGIRKKCTIPEQLRFVLFLRKEIAFQCGYARCSAWGMVFGMTPVSIAEAATKFYVETRAKK